MGYLILILLILHDSKFDFIIFYMLFRIFNGIFMGNGLIRGMGDSPW